MRRAPSDLDRAHGWGRDMAAAALMASRHEAHRVAGASEAVSLRPARIADCRRIAELFRISSEGVADYVWSQLQAEMPGLSLLEIGERRYQREDIAFSYQNCLVVERDAEVIGMMHSFVIEQQAPGQEQNDGPGDPVLRPYAELEAPGSLYIAGIALLPEHRGRGIRTSMPRTYPPSVMRIGLSTSTCVTRSSSFGTPQAS
jgi:Acetyltransferase (GNAT) family